MCLQAVRAAAQLPPQPPAPKDSRSGISRLSKTLAPVVRHRRHHSGSNNSGPSSSGGSGEVTNHPVQQTCGPTHAMHGV